MEIRPLNDTIRARFPTSWQDTNRRNEMLNENADMI